MKTRSKERGKLAKRMTASVGGEEWHTKRDQYTAGMRGAKPGVFLISTRQLNSPHW